MPPQPPGRRTESLFDNRYRYDHIYPRGRSGETLRAYDTQDNDRPVVIKRPAPQDAPPMRAGQEVSIRTERQALERLSGHPVLTELRGVGTFRIGGHTHDYIVMDRAEGQIIEDMVLEQAEAGGYLPELEILVIIDHLLGLLAFAHDKQVVYNDVDAKHLFWDRSTYRLKVIDWGNAVFLDEPGALPTVTRATDIYQCGELLYFILTGGNRLVTEVEEGGSTFFVNFGPDAERIPTRLQSIITRAVHPDPKRRFGTILDLRQALTDYRQPLERERDEVVSQVRKRVRTTASQEELERLAGDLQAALDADPGHPAATTLAEEIHFLLRQITIQADLDAIRIYVESNNWPRAHSLLHNLLPEADAVNEPLIWFLIAATALLEDLHITPAPAGFVQALDPLFGGDAPAAGRALLTTNETRTAARQAQWLLAEQLATLVSEVTLLRPHLVRLRHELRGEPGGDAALRLLNDVEAALDTTPLPGLTGLKVLYEQAAATLDRLDAEIAALRNTLPASKYDVLLAATEQAQQSAREVVSRLDDVGQHVYGDPPYASDLLHKAAMIDPTSAHFGGLHDYFDEIHQALQALSQFRPNSTGTNLAEWFADVQDFLQPYLDDIPDPQFHQAISAFHQCAEGWTTIINFLALGRRQPTVSALRRTADTIRPYNEHLAAWLGALANRLPDAPFTERHSPHEALGDALIDGWKAWDRGDGAQAAELGRTAYDLAITDGERLAATRLRQLGELLDSWLSGDGPRDLERTDQAESRALSLLLSEEEHERATFAEQMPSTAVYLRTMKRGIVASLQQSSSAGWRALYLHYVLRGMIALLDNDLDEAEFWREAAHNSFDSARTHPAFQVFDRALTGRRLVQQVERALNAVTGPGDLDAVRQTLNAPLAGELLTGAERALQSLTEALHQWSDGDFYATGQSLEAALENIQVAIQAAQLEIEPFVAWLTHLRDTAAELHQLRLAIEQGATTTSAEPDPAIAEAHLRIVTMTVESIGPEHAHQVRQWQDMYQAVLDTYSTQRLLRREKLAAFERHFASLFITKHPAYPLFRHWQAVIQALPPDEVEDDVIEVGDTSLGFGTDDAPAYLEDDREAEPKPRTQTNPPGGLPWNWIIAGTALLLVAAVALAVLRSMDGDDDGPEAVEPVATDIIAPAQPATAVTQAVVQPPPSQTRAPTFTPQPTDTPVPPSVTPTPSPVPSTPTAPPTESEPPTLTPAPPVTSTPLPTDAPGAVAGTPQAAAPITAEGPNRSVLVALEALPPGEQPWPEETFAPGDSGTWTLATTGSPDDTVSIEFSPELLSTLFQPGAANTLFSAHVILRLVGYDQGALEAGEVSFAIGVENTNGQRALGQVQFVDPTFVRLGLNQNDRFQVRTEVPQPTPEIELSVQRVDAATMGFYVDGRHLGDSVFVYSQGEPVTLVLYATGAEVEVEVSRFELDIRPRSELP